MSTLWVVATPIGNLEDITLRALRILREADIVLAEDTRRTGLLLKHHAIDATMRSFHAHTPDTKVEATIEELMAGTSFALVTDAGTPLVSDPGSRLVRAAREHAVRVEAIPGPSAVLAALSVAGIRGDRFRFEGFLPRSGSKRRAALERIQHEIGATVLFESARRLQSLLTDLDAIAPDRLVAVCRELTKLHEEVQRGTPAELAAHYAEAPKGEVTVVVAGGPGVAVELDPEATIREGLAAGDKASEIAKRVAASGAMSRKEAYQRVLTAQRDQGNPDE